MTEIKNLDRAQFNNTACVVYPAEYPSSMYPPEVEDLHSTIIFLGDVDEELGDISRDDLLDILSPIDYNVYQYVNVTGTALFDVDQSIPVLTLEMSEVLARLRKETEQTLLNYGIVSPSQFDYSPHVTIDIETYEAGNIPGWVLLRPAQLWYRGERHNLVHHRQVR